MPIVKACHKQTICHMMCKSLTLTNILFECDHTGLVQRRHEYRRKVVSVLMFLSVKGLSVW